MAKKLTPDSQFIVADSTVVNLFVAAFFLLMFITAVMYNSGDNILDWILYFGIVPAVVFTRKAFVKKAAITINSNGIYFYKSHVTNWKNFKAASAKQMPLGFARLSDKVVLSIEYFNDDRDLYYTRTTPLVNTQNKSEEQIIAAIEYFYGVYINKASQWPALS